MYYIVVDKFDCKYNLFRCYIIEKKKIEENRRRFSSKSDLGPLHLLLRLNSPSLQDASSTSSSSNSSEITNRTSSSSAKSNTLDIFNRDSASNKSISSNRKYNLKSNVKVIHTYHTYVSKKLCR